MQPSAIVGHSVGEVAAAYLTGALSLEDAVQVIFQRSRLQGLVAVSDGEWDIEVSIVAYRARNNARRAVSQVWARLITTATP